jgi:type IV pilus assembly protein PilN
MIAMNLLRRTLANEQRRRRRCQIEMTVGLFLLVGTFVVSGFIWWDMDTSISSLHRQEAQQIVTLREVEHSHSQLQVTNRQIADLRERSHRVTHLIAQHHQAIQLLDVVSHSLDPLRLWLSALEMEQAQVKLVGFAESKDQIVQFAKLLKEDSIFQNVSVREAGRASGESPTYHFIMDLLLTSEVEYGKSS